MRAKTTEDLVSEIRTRVAAPDADGLVTDASLLDYVDQELRTEVAALIVQTRSEYWLTTEDQTITSGQATYRIPDRSLGMGLRDVIIVDSSGNEWSAVQVSAADRPYYANATTGRGPAPFDFALDNGSVVLLPTPAQSGYTLRLRYYASPPTLVLPSECVAINYASSTTKVMLNAAAPTALQATNVRVDIVRGAGMYETIYADRIVKAYSSVDPSLTFEGTTPITVADVRDSDGGSVNIAPDYVCPSGTTCYLPVPEAVYPVLVALGCRAYYEVVGDMGGIQVANGMVQQKKSSVLSYVVPRVDGAQIKLIPKHTPLRGGRRRVAFGR